MKYIKIPADINHGMVLVDNGIEDVETEKVYEMFVDELRHEPDEDVLIECVRLGQTLKRNDLFLLVDEDGVRKDLLSNSRASALYGMFQHGSFIYGDAFLVGQRMMLVRDEDGEYEEPILSNIPDDVTLEWLSAQIYSLMPGRG